MSRRANNFRTYQIIVTERQRDYLKALKRKSIHEAVQYIIDSSNPDLMFLYEDALATIRELRKQIAMMKLEKEHPKLERFIEA
jgi:hypothetical protein